MEAYSILEAGGKQLFVRSNEVVETERLQAEVGETVTFSQVLAQSDGSSLTVGTPYVDGAEIKAEVVEHFRGPKLVAFKKKRRKGYKRKIGHRQELTRIKIL